MNKKLELKFEAGLAIINLCNNDFSTEKMHRRSVVLHYTFEETVCLNAKNNAFKAHLWSGPLLPVGSSETPRTPPQTFRALTSLLNTPDKRPFEKEEFKETIVDLTKEIKDDRFLVSELATAVMPFSFSGRSQYNGVLRMMAIFHITKQEELIKEVNQLILWPKDVTVHQVLKIPGLE
ncbi:11266_t:CDS:2 [Cetraspora pellucida]|uniref:11266_t:CDS:1 n=1 Tax=Cetraspora pellucida TaxID=1433469 RepID=A0ACA9K143_9GLOM|nr:11266_t:CDS:2 [Cetraspora pellucida]